jgi:hypothetical protein
MAGALVIAAGVPRAFEHGQWWIIIAGYAIARVGLIASWLRAAASDPPRRKTALRHPPISDHRHRHRGGGRGSPGNIR